MMKWETEQKGYDCNDCFLSMQNCHDKSIACEDETGLCDWFEEIPIQESKKDTLISRQKAINLVSDALKGVFVEYEDVAEKILSKAPSAQSEEVIPHRNYKYLSDYWCECGWHLGKKGEVKYCSECGRKVNWDG